MPLPNTFLIGSQKSGSTSLYNWISQHPDVSGDIGSKDLGFFLHDHLYSKGVGYLSDMYIADYCREKVIFHSSVEYIYYKKALLRIKAEISDPKFILILRNPLERIISAYNSCRNLQIEEEKNIIVAAIEKRTERHSSKDYNINSKLTYIDHSLYSKQLKTFYSLFNKNQLFVCFFEDLKSNPKKLVEDLYSFLEIDNKFVPIFSILNQTGHCLKFRFLASIFSKSRNSHSSLRRFFIEQVIDRFIPLNKRNKLKWHIREWNAIKNNELRDSVSVQEKEELLNHLIVDICQLERIFQINLDHWKKIN